MSRETSVLPTNHRDASDRFIALAKAAGLTHRVSELETIVELLTSPWGARPIGDLAGWQSNVADDGSPYEHSVVLGAPEPEVRLLVESQAGDASLRSRWVEALALSERIAERYEVDISRLRSLTDLFEPRSNEGFAMWHAVVIRGSRAPDFKVYLDAQAQGLARAAWVMEQATVRVGLPLAWRAMQGPLARGPERDEPKYFSLDLGAHGAARTKCYVRHHGADADFCRALFEPPLGDCAARLVEAFVGRASLGRRPVFSCHAFTDPTHDQPTARAFYFPVEAYAADDATIERRMIDFLADEGVDASTYVAALDALGRSTQRKKGLHSYVGLRWQGNNPRVTFYFSPNQLPL